MSAQESDPSDVTVRDLINMYGREAVRRGLSYMESLSEAEEEYKQSAEDGGGYAEGIARGVTDPEDLDPEKREEINERWAEGMEEGGLGLDDE